MHRTSAGQGEQHAAVVLVQQPGQWRLSSLRQRIHHELWWIDEFVGNAENLT